MAQKRFSSESSSPAQAGSSPGSASSWRNASKSQAVAHAAGSKRTSAQRASRTGSGSPIHELQAISTATSTRSPPAAASVSRASVRRAVAPALSPCSGSPSRHSVASLPLSHDSSTHAPAHASGIVPAIRNQ